MIDRILNVAQVADMLGCSEDTVRERTPRVLPGAKFGRDWVYVESQVIEAVANASATERDKATHAAAQRFRQQLSRGKPLPNIGGAA